MANKWRERYLQLPVERRQEIEAEVAELRRELPLRELRKARRLTQEQLAQALGDKQASVSKLEQRTDMYVSTLRRYLEAMGGELIIAARFPAGAIEISQFGEVAPPWRYEFEARNTGKAWEQQDVRQLRQLVRENAPASVIGLKLGRTPRAVQTKASKEGVSMKPASKAPHKRKKR